jgi:hypothetical protein
MTDTQLKLEDYVMQLDQSMVALRRDKRNTGKFIDVFNCLRQMSINCNYPVYQIHLNCTLGKIEELYCREEIEILKKLLLQKKEFEFSEDFHSTSLDDYIKKS